MWWESAIVFVLVGASFGYLLRSTVRSMLGGSSCASGCGKCPEAKSRKGRLPPPANARRLAPDPVDFRGRFPPPPRS